MYKCLFHRPLNHNIITWKAEMFNLDIQQISCEQLHYIFKFCYDYRQYIEISKKSVQSFFTALLLVQSDTQNIDYYYSAYDVILFKNDFNEFYNNLYYTNDEIPAIKEDNPLYNLLFDQDRNVFKKIDINHSQFNSEYAKNKSNEPRMRLCFLDENMSIVLRQFSSMRFSLDKLFIKVLIKGLNVCIDILNILI